MFLGKLDFKREISRIKSGTIHASLSFYPHYIHYVAIIEPMWNSLYMLEDFLKNSTSIAVPTGVTDFDENTIRSKENTGARYYINSKPVKFDIRFHGTFGWNLPYLHSLWDNVSANKTNIPQIISYKTVFRCLKLSERALKALSIEVWTNGGC